MDDWADSLIHLGLFMVKGKRLCGVLRLSLNATTIIRKLVDQGLRQISPSNSNTTARKYTVPTLKSVYGPLQLDFLYASTLEYRYIREYTSRRDTPYISKIEKFLYTSTLERRYIWE